MAKYQSAPQFIVGESVYYVPLKSYTGKVRSGKIKEAFYYQKGKTWFYTIDKTTMISEERIIMGNNAKKRGKSTKEIGPE